MKLLLLLPSCLLKQAQTLWERRLLDALVLTIENFATSLRLVKNKATVNVSLGMFHIPLLYWS